MSSKSRQTILYVDLDGTLIHSDLLIESFLDLVRRNLFFLFLVPFWLLRGKAWLKHRIAERVSLHPELLPYNQELLEYLHHQKGQGRRLVLISAANEALVQEVAKHLGLFDDAVGSDSEHNLSGKNKLQRIRQLSGDRGFAYAADAARDLPVWREADEVITVNATASLTRKLARLGPVSREFRSDDSPLKETLRALRPHQWLKNLLLFLPLLLGNRSQDPILITQTTLGFISFGLCASGVYLLNDMIDLSADRQHHSKRWRPFAAGTLSLRIGLPLIPLLFAAAFLLAWLALSGYFLFVLGTYFLCTLAYNFLLKPLVLVDVITLAVLYTLRIIAGAAAISVIPSFWLLAFSMFIFMSLAIAKRYAELSWLRETGRRHSEGRGYLAQDLQILSIFGSSSAFLAVMVFALYINSDDILQQYMTPEILWFICPLLLYLVSRIWLLANRGELDEDPVVFLLRDHISQIVILVGAILFTLAHLDWRTLLL